MVKTVSLLLFVFLTIPAAACAADNGSSGRAVERPEGAIVQAAELKQAQVDTNQDGRSDRFEYYDDRNVLVKVGLDLDFDGKVDEWQVLKDGKLSKALEGMEDRGQSDKWVMY